MLKKLSDSKKRIEDREHRGFKTSLHHFMPDVTQNWNLSFYSCNKITTGYFNTKRDVLNCLCDLDFEFLVFWLTLVGSWVVEIYAWSTIWNCFDLRQPQIKSVQIQSWFCSFFLILINFLLIMSLYDSIFSENNSLPDKF